MEALLIIVLPKLREIVKMQNRGALESITEARTLQKKCKMARIKFSLFGSLWNLDILVS